MVEKDNSGVHQHLNEKHAMGLVSSILSGCSPFNDKTSKPRVGDTAYVELLAISERQNQKSV